MCKILSVEIWADHEYLYDKYSDDPLPMLIKLDSINKDPVRMLANEELNIEITKLTVNGQ